MWPLKQRSEEKECIRIKEYAECQLDLIRLIEEIDKHQKTMTEEEKKRNEWAAWDGDEILFKYQATNGKNGII